jgi:glycosyltransferase involved in cell wall biosynthesis
MEKPIKSILIITYDMVPYSPRWGGCQRTYFLAEYLQNQGYDVNVIHSTEKYYGYFGTSPNFRQIPIGQNFIPIFPNEKTSGQKNKIFPFVINGIKFFLNKFNIGSLDKFFFNDANQWMGMLGYFFARNARSTIIKTIKEHNIEYVIISGPPFSLFYLAPLIKNSFPDVKVIFDYRDLWNTLQSTQISTFMERKYLKSADKVVFLNDRMKIDTLKKYNLSENKCETVLNGYSDKDWKQVEKELLESKSNALPENDKLIISYIGTFSFSNKENLNFLIFLNSFNKFKKNKNVLLVFVGAESPQTIERIKNKYPDCFENIKIIPIVNYQESLKFMLNSDILLVLHTGKIMSKYMLTGKLFDYIRSRKVIFGIGSTQDAYFLNIIEKFKLGLICLNQPDEILKKLEILYENWEQGTLSQLRQDEGLNINNFSRESQNMRYLKLLQDFEK